VSGELSQREARARIPSSLHFTDPVVRHLMLALAKGLRSGAPDLYAETAAEFLAVHILLTRDDGEVRVPTRSTGFERLRKVDDFLHANLGASLTLEAMANVAGLSKFHLLRTFKQAYNETPLQRLTRMRMDHAKTLLVATEAPITTVAFECGYGAPAHFAAAFRRFTGVTPSEYRRVR
jgi:AraC family transcriptional regulator